MKLKKTPKAKAAIHNHFTMHYIEEVDTLTDAAGKKSTIVNKKKFDDKRDCKHCSKQGIYRRKDILSKHLNRCLK